MSDRKLIVFDFDGTLVDSEEVFTEGLKEFSKNKSLPCNPEKMKAGYVNPSAFDLGWGIPVAEQEEMFEEYSQWLSNELIIKKRFMPILFDHVREVLQELSTDYDLSIITARTRGSTLATLDYYGLRHFFPHYRSLCCARDRGYPIKPAADSVHCLLDDTKHKIEDVVIIGDTIADIGMANAAGTKSIAALWGMHSKERLQQLNPTIMLESIKDLPEAMQIVFNL